MYILVQGNLSGGEGVERSYSSHIHIVFGHLSVLNVAELTGKEIVQV